MKRLLFATVLSCSAVLWPASPALAADHTVTVGPGRTFQPSNLTIAVGDTVTWTNSGGVHSVRADDDSFRCANGCDGQGGNGDPSTGWSFTLTFNDPGEIAYFCEMHGAPGGIGMSGSITVEASGGGENPPPESPATRFKSGFEEEDFADWDDRICPTCNAVAAALTKGESLFPQAGGYETERDGEHWAYLEGSVDSDFDLFLWWWSGSEWISVASGTSPDANESVSFDGDPGLYRWEVRAVSGAGAFILVFNNPDLAAGATNELIRSEDAARRGSFGLESAYFKGNRKRDYLVYNLPVDAAEFEAEFRINPLEGLFVKGKKHQILQALQGDKIILKVFISAPERGEDDPRIFAQVRLGNNKFSTRGFATLKTGKWRKMKIVWKAASGPEAGDGVVRLLRDKEIVWEIEDLDNAAHRINQLALGQISKGKKATAGQIYYDDFNARWEADGDPSGANSSPVASVTASPTSVPEGDGNQTVVTLDAAGSSDADGDPLSFSWTVPSGRFVNGTGASDETIQVTFPGTAPYTVTLVVSDGQGGNDSVDITIGLSGGSDGGYGA